jgi:predicted dehydrogenase
LTDAGVHACVIATRHDRHADEAELALRAGKGVFLEKPAALTLVDLEHLTAAVIETGRPFTLGFNRRFAPDVVALAELLSGRTGPLMLVYRVNAGRLPAGHWTLGPEGGGRLIGEACHMIDLAGHLAGCAVASWSATPIAPPATRSDLTTGDNVSIALRHDDGSLATIVYTALGHKDAGKETIEAHWDGASARIDDFRGLIVHGRRGGIASHEPDKGHRELMRRFVAYASGRAEPPVPHEAIFATSRLAIEIDASFHREGP